MIKMSSILRKVYIQLFLINMKKEEKEKQEIINSLSRCFKLSFINEENEIIIYPRDNTYFSLNTTSPLKLKCKVIQWLSREACKGLPGSRRYHFDGICDFFNKNFTPEDMDLIYTYLGNGIHQELCEKFVESGCDMQILHDYDDERRGVVRLV